MWERDKAKRLNKYNRDTSYIYYNLPRIPNLTPSSHLSSIRPPARPPTPPTLPEGAKHEIEIEGLNIYRPREGGDPTAGEKRPNSASSRNTLSGYINKHIYISWPRKTRENNVFECCYCCRRPKPRDVCMQKIYWEIYALYKTPLSLPIYWSGTCVEEGWFLAPHTHFR